MRGGTHAHPCNQQPPPGNAEVFSKGDETMICKGSCKQHRVMMKDKTQLTSSLHCIILRSTRKRVKTKIAGNESCRPIRGSRGKLRVTAAPFLSAHTSGEPVIIMTHES